MTRAERGWGLALLAALALLALGAACRADARQDRPPEVRYGEDVCDRCGMIISEPRFAAAYVTRDGVVRRFDDIGEMVLYHAEHGETVAAFWVHDYETEEWLPAPEASFVGSAALSTPMGHGVVALRTRERAQALAERVDGEVLDFQGLWRWLQERETPGHAHQPMTEVAAAPPGPAH